MPGPTTESLATDFRDLLREMTAARSEFASYREEFAGFRGSVDAQLGFLRWLGAFTAAILATLVGSAIWLSWHASAFSLRVEALEKSTSKVLDRLDQAAGSMKPKGTNP